MKKKIINWELTLLITGLFIGGRIISEARLLSFAVRFFF